MKFYKVGISTVWHNRRAAASIREQYKASSGIDLSRAIVERSNLYNIQNKLGKVRGEPIAVTRDQLLTVLRTERDWPKLPIFAVIFALFFEMTPLLLILFPRLAPTTCYSAAFNKKIVDMYRQKQAKLQNFTPAFSTSVPRLKDDEARALAQAVLPHAPILTKYMPLSWIRNRLVDHITFVRADNILLKEDALETLLPVELEQACIARAIPLGSISQQVTDLSAWIDEFQEPADAGFFFK